MAAEHAIKQANERSNNRYNATRVQRFRPTRQLLIRYYIQLAPLGHKVHSQKYTEVKQKRRYHSRDCNSYIADTEYFGHDESRCAHNRWCDLATGGCDRLDSRCKRCRITQPLHHRNGKGAGSRHIGHGTTTHHAKEAGSNGGNLGGTTRGTTANTHGQIHECPTAAGV